MSKLKIEKDDSHLGAESATGYIVTRPPFSHSLSLKIGKYCVAQDRYETDFETPKVAKGSIGRIILVYVKKTLTHNWVPKWLLSCYLAHLSVS